jgi:hypothetical protein
MLDHVDGRLPFAQFTLLPFVDKRMIFAMSFISGGFQRVKK